MRAPLLALALLVPAAALAQPEASAKSEIELATKAFQAEDFATALVHLQAAYNADPQPDLLYAIAQVEQKLGRCADAIVHYEQFLATNPAPSAKNDTSEAIATCKEKIASEPPSEVTPSTPVDATTSVGAEPRGPTPWYADPLGLGLIGGGVIVGAIGAVVYTNARGDLDAAEVAMDHATYEGLVDDARGKRTASAVMIGGGIVLIAAGVTRLVLRDRGTERSTVALVPTNGGSLLTWGGSF